MTDEPLFETTPTARLGRGDKVRVQTMWGVEFATVRRVVVDADGFPMVQLDTQSGDRITLNIARVQPQENGEQE